MDCSVKSLRIVHSTTPPDDSDVIPTTAPAASSSSYDESTVAVPRLVSGESPCAKCISNCAKVAAAVAKGDLSIRINCEKEACNRSALTTSINEMVSKLSNFTEEVIQVAAQSAEGKLGVQAKLEDEHGSWREVISRLNTMTVGYSEQVRDIASVCTAVARGDLSQKMTVSVKGETLVLKNTFNTM
ncbi:hypothetical protein EDD21DRAFT_43799, partial [Dissophora ornata]